MTSVTLIYMTPSLDNLEGVDPADEFESLDDLTERAGLDDLEQTLTHAVSYYLHLIEARESGRVMIGRPYDSERGVVFDDEECGDYHQADIKVLDMQVGSLEQISRRAGLESVDELLKRSLILFEKVVQAREAGWGVALYNQQDKSIQWIMDDRKNNYTAAPSHGPGRPTLQ